MIYATKPNRKETLLGMIYLIINLFVLPGLISTIHELMGSPLRAGQLNFLFFFINFTFVTLIFRKYLLSSLRDALKTPSLTIWYAVLGYMGNLVLGEIVTIFCLRIYPGFHNVNDSSIAAILQEDFAPMAFGTIVLVPLVEETLYRGLIFRKLYDKKPLVAYLLSTIFFAAIHVTGYIGQYEPLHLFACFLQYLPAGYCLAFAYRSSGTIVSPILMHMAVNAVGMLALR